MGVGISQLDGLGSWQVISARSREGSSCLVKACWRREEKRSEQCRGLGKPWETVGKYGEHMRTWRVFMGESIGKHRKNMGQYRKTMGTYGKQREDMNKTTK